MTELDVARAFVRRHAGWVVCGFMLAVALMLAFISVKEGPLE